MPLASLAPLLAVALSAASPELRDTALGALEPAVRAIEESATGALPPPPEHAVIETQTFGTITLDHRAHLARKTSCKSCHNPGPVTKLGRLPPKVAHGRCVACHEREERGPTACRDCHVKPAPPELDVVEASAMVPAGGAPVGGEAAAAGAGPGVVPILTAQLEAQLNAIRARDIEDRVRNPFKRVLGIGFSVLGGAGRNVTSGPAVYMTTREGRVILLYAIEHGATEGSGRTFGLIGAGVTQPVIGNWNVQALAVGGFDAMENPTSFAPNLGLRGGVEWLGRRMSVSVAGTVASDLTTNTNKLGQQTGGMTFSVSANIGYVVSKD
jgi:hypothetical protein